jgi:ActR/RegA family two-component response regulator
LDGITDGAVEMNLTISAASPPAHVLLVEDDDAIRNALRHGLERAGMCVEGAGL